MEHPYTDAQLMVCNLCLTRLEALPVYEVGDEGGIWDGEKQIFSASQLRELGITDWCVRESSVEELAKLVRSHRKWEQISTGTSLYR